MPLSIKGNPGTDGTFDTSFQGAWSAGTYTQGETVSHGGFLWVVLSASTTEEPVANSANWSKIAQSFLSGNISWVSSGSFTVYGKDATASSVAGEISLRAGFGLENQNNTRLIGASEIFVAGNGASSDGSNSATAGGRGGSFAFTAGSGGYGTASGINGAVGGNFDFLCGPGGVGQVSANGGAGGTFTVTSGSGGYADGAGKTAGAGGVLTLSTGSGGSGRDNSTPGIGGSFSFLCGGGGDGEGASSPGGATGGGFTFAAGNGGYSGYADGGNGGGFAFTAGSGGNSGAVAGNGGDGGDFTIDAGTFGTGAGSNGVAGDVNIGLLNADGVHIGRESGKLAFHDAVNIAKQTVSGARNNPEAALANLLTALANLGLITNSTTAS